MLVRQPCHEVERYAGGPDDGLVLMPDQLGQCLKKFLATEPNLVMPGPQMLRHLPCIGQLAVLLFAVAHRKSFNWFATDLGG